jgi:hypothetical protein
VCAVGLVAMGRFRVGVVSVVFASAALGFVWRQVF